MNIFFYVVIFIIGAVFGNFYSITIYRSKKGQNVIGKKQCPKCEHKLGILDLIPMFGYISSKGKCRYCNEKLGIKYLLLEVITGLLFVVISLAINLNIYNINIQSITSFIFIILYLTSFILIAGLDKRDRSIKKSILTYGILISVIYVIYLCIVEPSMYRYTIYLTLIIALLIIDNINLKKKANSNYTINILMLILIMLIFTGEYISIVTIMLTLIEISFYILISRIKHKKRNSNREYSKNLKIGFIICTTNIVVFLDSLICASIM